MSLFPELARAGRSSMAKTRSAIGGGHDPLRDRLLTGSGAALTDQELLELLLRSALRRHDVQPLATELMGRFGSLATVLSASPRELRRIRGIGDGVVLLFKLLDRLRSPQAGAHQRTDTTKTELPGAQTGLLVFRDQPEIEPVEEHPAEAATDQATQIRPAALRTRPREEPVRRGPA